MPSVSREEVARAVAFFDECDDIGLLHQLIAEGAPRARRMVSGLLAGGDEDAIPGPAELRAARAPATQQEATRTFRALDDFPLFQVLMRAVGRRIETIEIAASADFPVGARVVVPAKAGYPAGAPVHPGTVEDTGTHLRVLLDSGETWSGPPSLARLSKPG